ncbi:carbohydrate ABC transporter permease [Paenibacillus radicis (ex Xue et al. 2023)]|uniref:Carbohydrate ABC transporter permease n=1 Tax=Paenibacillus radicis (ex Xue et al. 2023) TaxID=2972489 RepID=A0ABT1YCQ1_9BACL|nr:carbohydrate ABC transporter permease [Paenibacillus radicis (ex Xue et al. 2023)]MCR8630985.1 carbohydrate ABC transporter permease [Paenibacillus radicis (ex Xue et al. 2023)]
MMTNRKPNTMLMAIIYAILIVACLLIIVPVLWMVSTSLKAESDIFSIPPRWLPEKVTFAAFTRLWTDYPFSSYFYNSLVSVAFATVLSLFFSTLAGFGASRFHFRGKGAFLTFLLVTQMFPSIMLLIPFYKIMSMIGLLDSLAGLVLTYISFTIPFCSWMMMGYFNTISKEIDDAAAIDGCSKLRIFWQIILPLTLPGLAATAIYSFIAGWNEYIFALVLITTETNKTVPIGIGQLIGQYKIVWNDLMAASLVASVPLTILFLFMQKYFISSLTAGAVKS